MDSSEVITISSDEEDNPIAGKSDRRPAKNDNVVIASNLPNTQKRNDDDGVNFRSTFPRTNEKDGNSRKNSRRLSANSSRREPQDNQRLPHTNKQQNRAQNVLCDDVSQRRQPTANKNQRHPTNGITESVNPTRNAGNYSSKSPESQKKNGLHHQIDGDDDEEIICVFNKKAIQPSRNSLRRKPQDHQKADNVVSGSSRSKKTDDDSSQGRVTHSSKNSGESAECVPEKQKEPRNRADEISRRQPQTGNEKQRRFNRADKSVESRKDAHNQSLERADSEKKKNDKQDDDDIIVLSDSSDSPDSTKKKLTSVNSSRRQPKNDNSNQGRLTSSFSDSKKFVPEKQKESHNQADNVSQRQHQPPIMNKKQRSSENDMGEPVEPRKDDDKHSKSSKFEKMKNVLRDEVDNDEIIVIDNSPDSEKKKSPQLPVSSRREPQDEKNRYETRKPQKRANYAELDSSESEDDASDVDKSGPARSSTNSGESKQKKPRKAADNNKTKVSARYLDDNNSENFRRRIRSIEEESPDVPELTVTRMVESANHEKSQKPWKVNTTIWNRLYDFQKEGVVWLQRKTDHRSGGILADQMGLGKTIQTAVYLRSIEESGRIFYKTTGLDIVLIVCPKSVITQWIKALNKWFPKLRVFVLHASSSTGRCENYQDDIFNKLNDKKKEFPNGAVVLTTYNLYTKFSERLIEPIWQVVILDEGHQIKNEETNCAQALKNLVCTQRFILSGTPFQNKLREFWKLIDFVYPGRLSDSDTFYRRFIQVINAGANLECSKQEAIVAFDCLVALHKAVKPLILRRLQKNYIDILNLPDKEEEVVQCFLTDRQRHLYEVYLATEQVALIRAGKISSLVASNTIRDICNHPGLHQKLKPDDDKFGPIEDSGKLKMTFDLLQDWFRDQSNRVLFFTQRITVIEMMEHFLDLQGIQSTRYTGKESAPSREKTLMKFKTDQNIRILLISTRAGSVGLNIAEANKVIIYDPDWNPAADRQAMDRCYRIGQTQNVSIFRMITVGTLEEKVYLTQRQKESIGAKVLDGSDESVSVPNNTIESLLELKSKGAPTDLDLFFPNEAARNSEDEEDKEQKQEEEKEDEQEEEQESSSETKQKKRILSGFEPKNLLASVFDNNKIEAMRQHSLSITNSCHLSHQKQVSLSSAVKDAVNSLRHTEGRLAHTWKEEFHKNLSKNIVAEYYVEKEKHDKHWKNVQTDYSEDREELETILSVAQDMLFYLQRITKKPEKFINSVFVKFIDRKTPIQMWFYREILSTLASSDENGEWALRPEYIGAMVLNPLKRLEPITPRVWKPIVRKKKSRVSDSKGDSKGVPSTSK